MAWQQASTWTNADQVTCRHMVSEGHIEFNPIMTWSNWFRYMIQLKFASEIQNCLSQNLQENMSTNIHVNGNNFDEYWQVYIDNNQ